MSDNNNRKDHILDTALDLFSNKGYEATKTVKIAEAAGINEVTLFRHFGTKMQLLEALIEREMPDPFELAAKAPRPNDGATPEEDLFLLGQFIHEEMSKRKQMMSIVLRETNSQPELVEKVSQLPFAAMGHIRDYFRAFVYYHQLKEQDPELLALTFFSFYFRSTFMAAFLKDDPLGGIDKTRMEAFSRLLLEGMGLKTNGD